MSDSKLVLLSNKSRFLAASLTVDARPSSFFADLANFACLAAVCELCIRAFFNEVPQVYCTCCTATKIIHPQRGGHISIPLLAISSARHQKTNELTQKPCQPIHPSTSSVTPACDAKDTRESLTDLKTFTSKSFDVSSLRSLSVHAKIKKCWSSSRCITTSVLSYRPALPFPPSLSCLCLYLYPHIFSRVFPGSNLWLCSPLSLTIPPRSAKSAATTDDREADHACTGIKLVVASSVQLLCDQNSPVILLVQPVVYSSAVQYWTVNCRVHDAPLHAGLTRSRSPIRRICSSLL